MISEHVSLAVAALAQVGEPARERIAKAVIARAGTYEQDGRVRIPGVAAASSARSRDARTGASAHRCRAAELILAAGNSRRPAYVARLRSPHAV
jgi:hypothetical protein